MEEKGLENPLKNKTLYSPRRNKNEILNLSNDEKYDSIQKLIQSVNTTQEERTINFTLINQKIEELNKRLHEDKVISRSSNMAQFKVFIEVKTFNKIDH